MTIDFWNDLLAKAGFEKHFGFNIEWFFNMEGLICWHRDEFVVWIDWKGDHRWPVVGTVMHPKCITGRIEVSRPITGKGDLPAVAQFIESLADHDLMGLCVGDEWCKPVLKAILKG